MLRRFYTVMIVPHEGGSLRRLSVSLNFLVSMAAIFLFCVVSSTFLGHFFLDGMYRVDEGEKLRAETERLAVENSRMRADLHRTILKIEDLSEILETREGRGGDSLGGSEWDQDTRSSLDGDWRASARAAQEKADFWRERLSEQLCAEADMARGQPTEWPVRGFRLTSGFQYRRDPMTGQREFHTGLDLAAPHGTEVMATADGVVTDARRSGGYGNLVRIDHGNGVETLYGHLKKSIVLPGQRVYRGDVVGFVGSTGRSTGPHLHYEIVEDGVQVNPLKSYLKAAMP